MKVEVSWCKSCKLIGYKLDPQCPIKRQSASYPIGPTALTCIQRCKQWEFGREYKTGPSKKNFQNYVNTNAMNYKTGHSLCNYLQLHIGEK